MKLGAELLQRLYPSLFIFLPTLPSVYICTKNNQTIAVKVLDKRKNGTIDEQRIEKLKSLFVSFKSSFVLNLKLNSSVTCPYIMQYYDNTSSKDGNYYFIEMEYATAGVCTYYYTGISMLLYAGLRNTSKRILYTVH